MSMSERELRAKRAAIRKEIKERMQKELDDRKKEIRNRIKREDISVEEKREKYRREAHEEKLRLMELAKKEFIARKRMLKKELGQEAEDLDEAVEEVPKPPRSIPPWVQEEEMLLQEGDEGRDSQPRIDPEEAFILEDDEEKEESTDEREALREYEGPIGEYDALPPEATWPPAGEPLAAPGAGEEEAPETNNLLYFIINLIFHPIQTLDQFDEYLASPGGIRNVVIFYFVSLSPIAVFILLVGGASEYMPGGMLGSIAGSIVQRQAGVAIAVGKPVLDLLLYSFSIAIVNYFVTDEANFITLTVYFAFVEAVTRVIIFTLVISAVLAAVISPPLLGLVALLLLAFLGWTIALNVIVLMGAYGHGFLSAFFLAIGAFILRKVAYVFFSGLIGAPVF